MIIEPQRKVLIPGFRGSQGRRHDERRARVFDLGRRARPIFAWCEEQDAERIRDAMVAGIPRSSASTATHGFRRLIRQARACSTDAAVLSTRPCTTSSTRDAATPCCLGQAIARGIAPDGGLYVPEEFPHFVTRQFRGSDRAGRTSASGCSQPFAAGDPLAGELGAICREAFNFPAPLVTLAECARARVGARAVSRPDLRVQGFRGALPRRVPGTHPPRPSGAS